MQLKKLRSEPEIFSPIEFKAGLNIITGERSGNDTKAGNKTNGVGKTLSINFIDFCFLADYKRNRISKIPKDILGESTDIILEFSCNNENYVIRRNIKNHGTPSIYVGGKLKSFSKLSDARTYLSSKCLQKNSDTSFRQIIRAFKRYEKTGYVDIDNPDGSVKDPVPYLHLFGISIDLHKAVISKATELIDAYKYNKELIKDIESLNISLEEAGAYVNDLKDQIDSIDNAVENLSQDVVYEAISDDISELDQKLEIANLKLVSIKEEIIQIEKMPEYQSIEHDDLLAVYNDCKQGLGDLIVKEIDEIQEFKQIIDSFKTEVLTKRKSELSQQKAVLTQEIRDLSNDYKQKTSVLDKSGNLRSLKVTLHEQQEKRQTFERVHFLYDSHLKQESKKITLTAERGTALLEFKRDRDNNEKVLESFQKVVLNIHEYLYGNKKASFDLEIKEAKRYDQKTFVKFDMQIDDSGSARTEQEKILIYDFALMFCEDTRKRHIGFLIHDGAFEGVNEDTKFQLFNWLHKKQKEEADFQYITTINRDSFEKLEANGDFDFDLNNYVRAEFSKADRFLRRKYVEKR